jgi:hypothetical protein
MEASGRAHAPAALSSGKEPPVPIEWGGGGLSGPGRFGEEKNLLHLPVFEPQTIQPVA